MVSDDAEDPVLQRATGTTIQWASGKNPGVKVGQNHLCIGRHMCVEDNCNKMTGLELLVELDLSQATSCSFSCV